MKGGLLALGALLALALAACHVDDYCVGPGCPGASGDDSGTPHDGAIDAPHDSGSGPDACIPTGAEICDGIDNDCNGIIDDNAAMVGDVCGVNRGQCTQGVYTCTNGQLKCTGTPASAEVCDNIDNDCDGVVDNGNPGGGVLCGSNVGECSAGVTTCVNGQIQCVGAIGTPGANPEICDGKDNDCDGSFDEDVPTAGPCGYPAIGQCQPGVLTCVGGQFVCVGGVGPSFELCDNIDQDCDGNPHNGYDLNTDLNNCGTCGHSCVGTIPNGTAVCQGGQCVPGQCDPNYHDDPNIPGPDCSYFCVYAGPNEACNGKDDDCDGVIDEDLVPPNICNQTGACAGTVASCVTNPVTNVTDWDCVYNSNVSTDSSGNIVPESTCDNIDNDCNGVVDDPYAATKGTACAGNGQGICQDKGHYQCDPAAPSGPMLCNIDQPGQTATTETCNGLDDDCNGVVDDGVATGALTHWISIGGGRSIMQYEANRPDSATTNTNNAYACDEPAQTPWTMVTEPQAAAACAAIGARLCTEQEWNRACSQVTGTTWPVTEPNVTTPVMFFEAEDYFSRATGTTPDGVTRAWVPDYTAGYSGISALIASPNTGDTVAIGNVAGQAPRLDYQVHFTKTANHYVWVHMYRNGAVDDGVHIGFNASLTSPTPTATRTVTNGSSLTWQWRVSGTFAVTANTDRFVSLWMDNDGVKVDAIVITTQNTTAPTTTTGPGGTYSYDANPNVYAGATCNGKDYSAANDNLIGTGTDTHCNTPWAGGGAFDLSGNVKEWTSPRLPGANPIRGGASNNIAGGLTCYNSFSLGDDSFFFNNVGFRCCK